MNKQYLEQIRAHVDEGGQLNHRNGVELLDEVERLQLDMQVLNIVASLAEIGLETVKANVHKNNFVYTVPEKDMDAAFDRVNEILADYYNGLTK